MQYRSIQVLRGVAALAVVLLHATAIASNYGPSSFFVGGAGVDLFFVISGFIIAKVAPGRSAGPFLLKRAWRIYPLWWVACLPFLLAQPKFWTASGVVGSLALWPVFDGFHVPALIVGWSLSFELMFYLGAALALATRPIVPVAICLAAMALDVPMLGSPMVLEFCAGLLIARASIRPLVGGVALVAGVVALTFSPPELAHHKSAAVNALAWWRVVAWGVPAALVVYGALCFERWTVGRLADAFVWLGNASYSIYLFHLPVALMLPAPWPIKALAGVAVGAALHVALERRLMALAFLIPVERRAAAKPVAVGPRIDANLVQRPAARRS